MLNAVSVGVVEADEDDDDVDELNSDAVVEVEVDDEELNVVVEDAELLSVELLGIKMLEIVLEAEVLPMVVDVDPLGENIDEVERLDIVVPVVSDVLVEDTLRLDC